MILGTDNRKRWNRHDFLLSQAYTFALEIIKGEECPQCGMPKYICHDSENAVRIHLDEDFCNVKFEIEKKQAEDRKASEKKDDGGRSMWGSQIHPRIEFVGDASFESVRKTWLKEQRRIDAARAGIALDELDE